MSIGAALSEAIARARAAAGDTWAQVRVVAPSVGSADLARRALGNAGPFLRVRFSTVEGLLAELGAPALARAGLAPEPAGWLAATLALEVARLGADGGLAGYGSTLALPGWSAALERAVRAVEQAGLTQADLRAVPAPPGAAERLEVLAALVEAVAAARKAAGLYGRAELHAQALAAVSQGGLPVHRDQATVVFGDRMLAPGTFAALEAWCASRPCVRLALSPLENLAPAARGIRAAAAGAIVVSALVDDPGALGVLRRRLFAEGGEAAPSDAGVEAVATLDQHREVGAAVRRALDAVTAGTPLDRIAFVLPEASAASLLREALAQAGLPATWLTGPPLGTSGPARLLRLALSVSAGEDRAEDWYRLLRAPALRLRARLGPAAVRGRGRWRRLLSEVGVPRGTDRIEAGLRALAAEPSPEAPGRLEATQALLQSITALQAAFAEWPVDATFAEHARAWAGWLRAWASRRPERLALEVVLDGVGRAAGPHLGRRAAARLLEQVLAGVPWLGGQLDEPNVRVLPPMEAAGGDFELMLVLGLAEGRFPAPRAEDPLITDAVVEAVASATGLRLEDADARRAHERRRFAAALSAASGTVWLSAPAHDLTSGRPQAPSTLLFDVQAALRGRRTSLAELEAWLARPDCDPAGAPLDPARALSAGERRVALSRRAPALAAAALAQDTVGRRLMGLQRAQDRLAEAAATDAPRLEGWTGLVAPDVLATLLQDRVLSPGAVQRLLQAPHLFFFQDLLGAWPATRLPSERDPTEPEWLRRAVQDALTEVGGWAPLQAGLEGWLAARWAAEPGLASLAEPLRRASAARFAADLQVVGEAAALLREAEPLHLPEAALGATGWRLAERAAFRAGEQVALFVGNRVNKGLVEVWHDVASACASVAAARLGMREVVAVGRWERTAGAPTVGRGRTEALGAALVAAVEGAYGLAQRGLWPFGPDGRDRFLLERDVRFEVLKENLHTRLLAGLEGPR
jgi:hypothetical protein